MQVTLANWRSSPHNRWAFHHVRELVIAKVSSQAIPLDAARMALAMKGVDELRRRLG